MWQKNTMKAHSTPTHIPWHDSDNAHFLRVQIADANNATLSMHARTARCASISAGGLTRIDAQSLITVNIYVGEIMAWAYPSWTDKKDAHTHRQTEERGTDTIDAHRQFHFIQTYLLHGLCQMFIELLFPIAEFLNVPLQVLHSCLHLRHLGLGAGHLVH